MIKVEYAPGRARGEGRVSSYFVKQVAGAVSRKLKLKEDVVVSVALVDRQTIKRINKAFRGLNEVTDVLSFLYDEPDVFGEVVVCTARAREQAIAGNRTLKHEIAELIAHGLLHIFGYDHVKASEAKRMLSLQESILKSIV